MIKYLRYSLLSLLVLMCGSAFAEDVTFDFDANGLELLGLSGYSAIGATDGDITENKTATIDGVSVTISTSTSSTSNRLWSSSPRLRCYGGTITISAPDGYTITNINFVNGKWNANNSADCGTLASGVWTGNSANVDVSIAGNTQIKQIIVTTAEAGAVIAPIISGQLSFVNKSEVSISAEDGATVYYTTNGDAPTTASTQYSAPFEVSATTTVKAIAVVGGISSDVAEVTFTKVDTPEALTVASMMALTENKTNVALTLDNAIVRYIDGSSVYVKQGDYCFQLYGTGLTFAAGDIVSGNVYGDFKIYNGVSEITKNNVTVCSDLNITSADEAPTPTKTTVADVLAEKNFCDYVVLTGYVEGIVSETDATKTNYYLVVDEDMVQLYGKDSVVKNIANDKKIYDVVGLTNSIYNGKVQIKPLSATENVNTAISNVKSETNADGIIYNLAGQQRSKLAKGINIVNGKKVIK